MGELFVETMARRPISLRQIEAFRAIIDSGTVSRAAAVLNISQPAVSKLLAHLEDDSGIELFDRINGRLQPTERGMRLYDEVDRIFAGIRQVERAVDSIRREQEGQLVVGVMPALAGSFVQRTVRALLAKRPGLYVSIITHSSVVLGEWLSNRQIDVALVGHRPEKAAIVTEAFMRMDLACVLPIGHRLTALARLTPEDLREERFIAFASGSQTRRAVDAAFEQYGLRPNVVLDASTSPMVGEFVASGLGVSIMHPLLYETVHGAVEIRPFDPPTPYEFYLCRSQELRNPGIVQAFVDEVKSQRV